MKTSPDPATDKYSQVRCPNPSCPVFNQPGRGNIGHRAWSGKNKDIEWLRCDVCKREFSERQGTLMEKTKLPEATVTLLLKCQRWGVCDDGTADICDVDLKTVRRFQQVAGRRAEQHHHHVVRDVDVAGVQLDEMHSKLKRQRAVGVLSALAQGSQFLLWIVVGQRARRRRNKQPHGPEHRLFERKTNDDENDRQRTLATIPPRGKSAALAASAAALTLTLHSLALESDQFP